MGAFNSSRNRSSGTLYSANREGQVRDVVGRSSCMNWIFAGYSLPKPLESQHAMDYGVLLNGWQHVLACRELSTTWSHVPRKCWRFARCKSRALNFTSLRKKTWDRFEMRNPSCQNNLTLLICTTFLVPNHFIISPQYLPKKWELREYQHISN